MLMVVGKPGVDTGAISRPMLGFVRLLGWTAGGGVQPVMTRTAVAAQSATMDLRSIVVSGRTRIG
jgi:hypothetical protein